VASSPSIPPDKILTESLNAVRQRGIDYDPKGFAGGERSMAKTVEIFKAWTGIELTELEGWRFMQCMKMARSLAGKPKLDTYVDRAAFAALEGECALGSRLDPVQREYTTPSQSTE
jgi:hypothetical protein